MAMNSGRARPSRQTWPCRSGRGCAARPGGALGTLPGDSRGPGGAGAPGGPGPRGAAARPFAGLNAQLIHRQLQGRASVVFMYDRLRERLTTVLPEEARRRWRGT